MRIVHRKNEFQDALTTARSEAERAFGDGSLLIEKYVEGARHVEIQILGDQHGNLMHLFERDCSVQRRHQKIIEESPAPGITVALREKIAEAALTMGRKLGYTNAGTVEFLLTPQGEFYFIEVNTRIQVEHPVTEMVTGLDLVRMQIEIAQGMSLPAQRPRQSGYAIEARLYAEEPTNGFLPSTGTLHVWEPPHGMEGVRVDSSVEAGTEIGVYYDPLLAKIIAHGADRETALRKLVYALKHCAAQGVGTNQEFLIDLFEHEDFRAGRAHTGFQLLPKKHTEHDNVFAEVARPYVEHNERARRKILPSVPIGYRNNPVRLQGTGYRLQIDGRLPATAGLRQAIHGTPGPSAGNGEQVTGHREDQTTANRQKAEILRITDQGVAAMVNGIHHHFDIHVNEDEYY